MPKAIVATIAEPELMGILKRPITPYRASTGNKFGGRAKSVNLNERKRMPHSTAMMITLEPSPHRIPPESPSPSCTTCAIEPHK